MVVAVGIKLYYRRSIGDGLLIGSHDPASRTNNKTLPRHRRPADPSRLRAGVVCLSDQPFPQPRARQYLDGGARRMRPLPYAVRAVAPGWDGVLCRGPAPPRSRDLGALPAPGISLEGDRAPAARARLEHSGAHHHPYCRRAARPGAVPTRKTLPAGALFVLGRAAVPDMADVCSPDHRLGPRLHRSLFLAPDESILPAHGAVSAGRRGPDSDAALTPRLSAWPHRPRRHPQPQLPL